MTRYTLIIDSILQQDLYADTMAWGALSLYPKVRTDDVFIDRDYAHFPFGFADELRRQVELMADLRLQTAQADFMRRACYYLPGQYIDWRSTYRFDPNEVTITQDQGRLQVGVHGNFYRTVFWETPLLALITELKNRMTWKTVDGAYLDRARAKGLEYRSFPAPFSEFGTRRRFSAHVQRKVLETLLDSAGRASEGGVLLGTSNLQLAMDYNLKPMGTYAHKWVQLHAGLYGARMANRMAMEAWQKVYDTRLGIALTDTLTTKEFLTCFDRHLALLFDGVRQDSGNPFEYTDLIIQHYRALEIDPMSKTILFSDSLDVGLVGKLVEYCRGKIKCVFGIGTSLTHDILGVKAPRIVMKQWAVYLANGRKVYTVKIPDDPGKSSGDPKAQEHACYELGIER